MSAESKNPLLLAKLVALAVAMFMFAIFVLPPLYDLFCEITGIGGKTDGAYTAVAVEVAAVLATTAIASDSETDVPVMRTWNEAAD